MQTLKEKLRLLAQTQEKKYIPHRDRTWFWRTFKALREQGLHYQQAWDYTCWALEHHYGLHR